MASYSEELLDRQNQDGGWGYGGGGEFVDRADLLRPAGSVRRRRV
jgi:hypothetical protein